MLDQAASKIGDAVSGGDKGKRTLALTSLTTDKLISQLGSLIPILLLLFIKTFNSELFSKESLACEPRAYLNFTQGCRAARGFAASRKPRREFTRLTRLGFMNLKSRGRVILEK